MKPTLEKIKDNYDRVLLQLENGHLAGIKKINSFKDCQVVEQHVWVTGGTPAIDLCRGYKRESVYGYNIDRIKFLSDRHEVDNFLQYEDCEIDWDWDINYINNSGGEIVTCSMWGIDDPLFEKASVKISDDQIDAYTYSMFGTRYNITEIDDIIKGENKTMNNILDIYGDRKRGKINKHYEQLMELTKLADERYAIFKDCSDKLDKLYKEDGVITNHLVEPRLAETTKKHLEKLAKLREEEFCKLENLMREVHAQLSMCETYEQKMNILKTYGVINEKGKIKA